MSEDIFKKRAADWDSPLKVAMSEKFLAEMLKTIRIDNSAKAMELGCGTGLVGLQLTGKVKSLIMVDNSKAMTDKLREKLALMNFDKENTENNIRIINGTVEKYNSKDLDLIFSLMAFHHIENIQETLCHISQILKPGGILVIGDLKEEDGSFHGEERVPHNGFNIEVLARQIELSDLNIIITYTYNSISKLDKDYEQFIIVAQKK